MLVLATEQVIPQVTCRPRNRKCLRKGQGTLLLLMGQLLAWEWMCSSEGVLAAAAALTTEHLNSKRFWSEEEMQEALLSADSNPLPRKRLWAPTMPVVKAHCRTGSSSVLLKWSSLASQRWALRAGSGVRAQRVSTRGLECKQQPVSHHRAFTLALVCMQSERYCEEEKK